VRSWPSPDVPVLAGTGPDLRLYDAAADAVIATSPGETATLYVCGITPYDATHLGHAATYLAFDLVHRYWRAQGRDVHYVQNTTDIDDPLLERAERDGIDWVALAHRETELFRQDMTALRVLPPRDYIGAVEAMDEISTAVAALVADGAAYRVDDQQFPDVYYDITASGRFGYESRMDRDEMLALFPERGGDPDRAGKRDPLDPLLWRMARPNEPSWESSLGPGRPGWHIECAAIAGNRLGTPVDVQGGGVDLIYPHHECSAAHAEVLFGVDRFAQHYTHAGMIGLDGEKMSKSRGNLVFVSKLRAAGVDPMAIRAALLAQHYRTDRMWTDDALTQAQTRLAGWRAAATRPGADASKIVQDVRNSLADDLDTATAFSVLDRWSEDDTLAGAEVAVAVDALLGLTLN
jgi:L-cysteine:1D-myo-inositol 2-amino-2-deoxy-alpha-D-glucopyranoside ligase